MMLEIIIHGAISPHIRAVDAALVYACFHIPLSFMLTLMRAATPRHTLPLFIDMLPCAMLH